jgi:beta-galactosidase
MIGNQRYVSDKKLLIGASWYPEMWPDTEWERDVSRMRELGYTVTRLFEFAWHRFEPQEGQYHFEWALQVLDLLHEAGIKAILGTPTAAPPAWLTATYPDVLRTGPGGVRETHGKRKHYNHHSSQYRKICVDIVDRMAQELGEHPAVLGWQIDNEMSGYDYGPETCDEFHRWLKTRYGSVDALNRTWGLEFWSQAYAAFEQVPLAVSEVGSIEIPERHHPSLIMAIARFQNDGWTSFIREQCDVIRRHSFKPITTNMVGSLAMNWFQHNRVLDCVGASMYKDVDHYAWNWPTFDRMRAEKLRPYWLLETAPSWSAGGRIWNIHLDENGLRLMAWMSILMGGSMVLFWQWRSHWAGQEMLHGTLVSATGQEQPNWDMHRRLGTEFEALSQWLMTYPPQSAQLAILLNNEAAWAFSIDPFDDDMVYDRRWRDDFYLPLAETHIWRDVIDENQDFMRYKVIVLPLMPILTRKTRDRLTDWVKAGGHLLIGPMTGHRTEEFTAWTEHEFGGLEDLLGAESSTRFPAKWIEDRIRIEFEDGATSRTRAWCEGFACTSGQPLAHYRGGYGNGHVAVVEHTLGRGSVITLGCLLDRATYLYLVRRQMDKAGIVPVAEGDRQVQVVPRATLQGELRGYGVFNVSQEKQRIRLPQGGKDLFTSRPVGPELEIDPLGVLLIQV